MIGSLSTGRHKRAVSGSIGVAALTAVVLPELLLCGCTPAGPARDAWRSYVSSEANYEQCRAQRHPKSCESEWETLKAERARYHAAADGAQ